MTTHQPRTDTLQRKRETCQQGAARSPSHVSRVRHGAARLTPFGLGTTEAALSRWWELRQTGGGPASGLGRSDDGPEWGLTVSYYVELARRVGLRLWPNLNWAPDPVETYLEARDLAHDALVDAVSHQFRTWRASTSSEQGHRRRDLWRRADLLAEAVTHLSRRRELRMQLGLLSFAFAACADEDPWSWRRYLLQEGRLVP